MGPSKKRVRFADSIDSKKTCSFLVGENRSEIFCDRLYIASLSNFLNNMLYFKFKSAKLYRIPLPEEISVESFNSFVQYSLTGKLTYINYKTTIELYILGQIFELCEYYMNQCKSYLFTFLSTDTELKDIIRTLNIIAHYNDTNVFTSLLQVIKSVWRSDYKQQVLINITKETLITLLKNKLSVFTQDQLFSITLSWIARNVNILKKREVINELISFITFAPLNDQEIELLFENLTNDHLHFETLISNNNDPDVINKNRNFINPNIIYIQATVQSDENIVLYKKLHKTSHFVTEILFNVPYSEKLMVSICIPTRISFYDQEINYCESFTLIFYQLLDDNDEINIIHTSKVIEYKYAVTNSKFCISYNIPLKFLRKNLFLCILYHNSGFYPSYLFDVTFQKCYSSSASSSETDSPDDFHMLSF